MQFEAIQSDIQEAIMSYEYPPHIGDACPCGSGLRRLFRCYDCLVHPTVCSQCLLRSHEYEHFHWAEVWTGYCFEKCELSALGRRIYLGHDGSPCPAIRGLGRDSKLTVVDSNGIHDCFVVYCECAANIGPHSIPLQLLRSRLFPYTTTSPETAVTFRCLSDYVIHSNASRKSAYDHMKALYAMTAEEYRVNTSVSLRCP